MLFPFELSPFYLINCPKVQFFYKPLQHVNQMKASNTYINVFSWKNILCSSDIAGRKNFQNRKSFFLLRANLICLTFTIKFGQVGPIWVSWCIKKPMYNFKYSFFPDFTPVIRANIFTRCIFCRYLKYVPVILHKNMFWSYDYIFFVRRLWH